MRSQSSGPSLVPALDVTVYLVLDDFGRLGRAYREADEERSDRESIIHGLMVGEYTKPLRVVAFNSAEGWARDVSKEIALEVLSRTGELPDATQDFINAHVSQAAARDMNAR